MADDMYASGFDDAASFGRQATKVSAKGFNPTLTVLVIVVGIVLLFLIGNYVLYAYAQKVIPPRKKKPISKKKLKRERLKAGVMPAGE